MYWSTKPLRQVRSQSTAFAGEAFARLDEPVAETNIKTASADSKIDFLPIIPPKGLPPESISITSTYVAWNLYQKRCARATARSTRYLSEQAIHQRQRHFFSCGQSCASVPNFGPRQIQTAIPASSA